MKDQISRFLEDDREMDREMKAGAFLFELVHYLQEKGIEPELALHRYAAAYMRKLRAFEDYVIEKAEPFRTSLRKKPCGSGKISLQNNLPRWS